MEANTEANTEASTVNGQERAELPLTYSPDHFLFVCLFAAGLLPSKATGVTVYLGVRVRKRAGGLALGLGSLYRPARRFLRTPLPLENIAEVRQRCEGMCVKILTTLSFWPADVRRFKMWLHRDAGAHTGVSGALSPQSSNIWFAHLSCRHM